MNASHHHNDAFESSGEDWASAIGGPIGDTADAIKNLVGYLNFSSGPAAAPTLQAWNCVHDQAAGGDVLKGPPPFLVMRLWLEEATEALARTNSAFQDVSRVRQVVRLIWSGLLPAYLDYHRDLLFHQPPEVLFNGFFLGRAAEAVLGRLGDSELPVMGPAHQTLIDDAIRDLNDFVGYRPVAVLENHSSQPYSHEFVRPVPLYVQGCGFSSGPYQEIVQRAMESIEKAPEEILRAASLDPTQIRELCFDPRAYDFDHPVNRRPNYHFGGWDERHIDNDGRYDRFILRCVTMDALLQRVQLPSELPREELMAEASSVLAGTMLMASGISGWGPNAYSSEVTLRSLMGPIAEYRDEFYRWRIANIAGPHGERLRSEEQTRHQPFGAARQHLNAALATRRAEQLQHVQLARIFARMGYPDSAKRQADVVAAASARLQCRIDCDMTLGLRALRAGRIEQAAEVPAQTFDLIQRSIECGALMDPWDILGFTGNFSLYPGTENAIPDTRVDELLYLLDSLFGYIARVWSEAAARDNDAIYQEMESQYREVAEWWRQYAAHTVESIDSTDPWESFESARLVARALRLWHRGGATKGDIAFWAPHADLFDSPRAYTLVISALLERKDFVPAQALLIHWLSQAESLGIRSGGHSLPRLAQRWLIQLRHHTTSKSSDLWQRLNKFFDYLEANAASFWSVPEFQLFGAHGEVRERPDWEEELLHANDDLAGNSDESNGLFDAAYEDMTYQDTTDDGHEGAVYDPGQDSSNASELELEAKRLADHLDFLQSLARMWSVAADVAVTQWFGVSEEQSANGLSEGSCDVDTRASQIEALRSWATRAAENRTGLLELLANVRVFEVKPAGTDNESMRSYDRKRVLRDSLMERIIATAVEMSDARRLIAGALAALEDNVAGAVDDELVEDDAGAIELFAAMMAGQTDHARSRFPDFVGGLLNRNLLYIPLSRGGDPVKIYVTRLRERNIRHLLHWLPRCGMLAETCRLIETARQMEQRHPIGVGAVTEFDGLYRSGYRALVEAISQGVLHANALPRPTPEQLADGSMSVAGALSLTDQSAVASTLIPLLERLTETMLGSWLSHSQTLRLSPLESVSDPKKWKCLVDFITHYGEPLFTQSFLQLSNIRAVLHQGVDAWLKRAINDGDELLDDTALVRDLDNGKITLAEASRWVTLVFDSLMDHHAEYQDYNSTTTQSDRGELIYTFLDFLRLRTRYDRVAWNLKPIMWTHQVLVRLGLDQAAHAWRQSLHERIASEAEQYVQRLKHLQGRYSMRMPTVADRINERFMQPMTVDRMRALVAPAMADAEAGRKSTAFDRLEEEAAILSRSPIGVGLDLPAWISEIEEEVEQIAKRNLVSEIDPQELVTIATAAVPLSDIKDQLKTAQSQGRGLPHMRRRSS